MIIVEITHSDMVRVYEVETLEQAVDMTEGRNRPLTEWLSASDESFKAVFDAETEEFTGWTREITEQDRVDYLSHDLKSFHIFETSAAALEYDFGRHGYGKAADMIKSIYGGEQ